MQQLSAGRLRGISPLTYFPPIRMHLLVIFIFVTIAFTATPLTAVSPSSAPPPQAHRASVEIHYTKGGIVQIVPSSGATRFIPYRLAGEMDRRRNFCEAA